MRPRSSLLSALCLAAFAGCGATDAEPDPPAPPVPSRVVVPQRDATPPSAALMVGGVRTVSPSRLGERRPIVELPAASLRATGIARDREGTGRIRVSTTYVARCRGAARRVTRYLPPAQIARVQLAPGVRAPVERRRSARIALDPACAAEGEVWAEATNAHGLQAVTRHVRFRYAGRRG